MTPHTEPPWYRQIDGEQWKAFLATFFGWLLDGFDFTIMTFILIDIQNSFAVDRALAGALGTVTLMFRLVGGLGAGMAADRWGRKLPLMLSILWFSIFAFLSGFSTSYAMLFAFRASLASAWAASGRRGCHWRSSTGQPGTVVSPLACCRVVGTGALSFPR